MTEVKIPALKFATILCIVRRYFWGLLWEFFSQIGALLSNTDININFEFQTSNIFLYREYCTGYRLVTNVHLRFRKFINFITNTAKRWKEKHVSNRQIIVVV